MRTLELAMSVIGTALQVCLCFVLLARGYSRQFLYFTSNAVASVVTSAALILVRNNQTLYHHQTPYFYVYWVSEALAVALIFLALEESFYLVFLNFLAIRGFKWLFPGIGILMLLLAGVRVFSHPFLDVYLLTIILISLKIAIGFLQFGLFCLFIMLVRFFHMRRRQHAFGVVLGFGIIAAADLVFFLLRSEFGTKFDPIVRFTSPLAYIVAVVVWLATFLRAEPSHPMQDRALALTPEQMIFDLRRYTKAVKGVLER